MPANHESYADGLPELQALGEGGTSGELVPGRSLVFSALEVCLCLLVRQLPALNPVGGKAPTSLLHQPVQAGPESGLLIAAALNALDVLPDLCSPAGTQC